MAYNSKNTQDNSTGFLILFFSIFIFSFLISLLFYFRMNRFYKENLIIWCKNEEKYNRLKIIKSNCIAKLSASIKKIEDEIKDDYLNCDIFMKYHNLVAIFSFLEYFLTGRCKTYDGKDGAYNLFENECRLNRIFFKLDPLTNDFDKLKENQFLLYSEIKQNISNFAFINEIHYDNEDGNIDEIVFNKIARLIDSFRNRAISQIEK